VTNRYEVGAKGLLAKEIMLTAIGAGVTADRAGGSIAEWSCREAERLFAALSERKWIKPETEQDQSL
jgi:hypothetical protein